MIPGSLEIISYLVLFAFRTPLYLQLLASHTEYSIMYLDICVVSLNLCIVLYCMQWKAPSIWCKSYVCSANLLYMRCDERESRLLHASLHEQPISMISSFQSDNSLVLFCDRRHVSCMRMVIYQHILSKYWFDNMQNKARTTYTVEMEKEPDRDPQTDIPTHTHTQTRG